MNIMEEIFE